MNTNSVYGPQFPGDNAFTARMRFHQSWWRQERLGVSVGTDRMGHPYGNYLEEDAAAAGKNFLTPEIAAYARGRIAKGGGVEEFRCTRNLLSSQPMAFNLFGPLHLDRDLARALLDPLLPYGVADASVDIEWRPDPSTHLRDATSFDAVINYTTADGRPAIASIETKLTEPFSRKRYHTECYREVAARSSVWLDPADPALATTRWNQIWRNQLLVESIRQQPDADPSLLGFAIVVHHPRDTRCADITREYQKFLTPPGDSFKVLTLEDIIEEWQPLVFHTTQVNWLMDFYDRYLNLKLSEDAWQERREDQGLAPYRH